MTDTEIRLQDYIDVKEKLKKLKGIEATMRIQLVEKYFGDERIGTYYKEVHNFELKCVKSLNTSLDLPEKVELTEEEWDCVKTKYSLLQKPYKLLEDSTLIDQYITQKDAMPTLVVTS